MADDDPTISIGHVPPPDGADRLSAILTAIAKGQHRERISIADLLHALEHRAIGALMFIFAVPNAIPVPPGVSAILGAPLIFLSFQLMIGRRPWLPAHHHRPLAVARRLRAGGGPRGAVAGAGRAADAAALRRSWPNRRPSIWWVPCACVLSIILFLPIPLGNMLPAFTICVLALGVLERDGVWIGIGVACAIAAVVIVWGVMLALLWGALFVLGNLFGITLPFG